MKHPFLLVAALVLAPLDMLTYADNAILNAAENGYQKVTLVYGRASVESVEAVSKNLAARGYKIDDETTLLNPGIIRILKLKDKEAITVMTFVPAEPL